MMEQRAKYVAKAKKIALEPEMEEKPRKSGGGRVSTRNNIKWIHSELESIIMPPPLLLLWRHTVFILSSCLSQTIVCMFNYSYVLEENSFKLCMLPYYHMENRYRILIKPFLKELLLSLVIFFSIFREGCVCVWGGHMFFHQKQPFIDFFGKVFSRMFQQIYFNFYHFKSYERSKGFIKGHC